MHTHHPPWCHGCSCEDCLGNRISASAELAYPTAASCRCGPASVGSASAWRPTGCSAASPEAQPRGPHVAPAGHLWGVASR